jgi:hypothetical protein
MEAGGTIYDTVEPEPADAEKPSGEKPAAEAAKPADKPIEKPADDPLIKLKVDGREIELPQSEVVRLAQVNTALSDRERRLAALNNEIAAKQKQISERAPAADTTAGRQPSEKPTDTAPAKPTKLDKARLQQIAEDIRSGTDEEAQDALAELADAQMPSSTTVLNWLLEWQNEAGVEWHYIAPDFVVV